MTKEEALDALEQHEAMTHQERERAIVTALEHGASRDEVGARLDGGR
jgi:hypothetical protein